MAIALATLLSAGCSAGSDSDGGPWLSVSAGAYHSCAVARDHRAFCWGNNLYGALGDGSTERRLTPVPVSGDIPFDSISAGYDYTCALTANGEAWCWGENFGGQLGDGSRSNRLVPVRVQTGERFRTLSAGEAHTCGIGRSGTSYCWGAPLATDGNGTNPPDQLIPAVLPGPAFAQVVSGYEIACARTESGDPWCWGLLVPGIRFADTTQLSINVPAPVEANGLQFVEVGAGSKHACGITTQGAAWCWGLNPGGQLGDGTQSPSLTPRQVLGGIVFAKLAGHGPSHACGLSVDGTAWCWGANAQGALGNGTRSPGLAPVQVAGNLRFASLSAGFHHTCAVTLDGRAWCWGYGGLGQLGNGDSADVVQPVEITSP